MCLPADFSLFYPVVYFPVLSLIRKRTLSGTGVVASYSDEISVAIFWRDARPSLSSTSAATYSAEQPANRLTTDASVPSRLVTPSWASERVTESLWIPESLVLGLSHLSSRDTLFSTLYLLQYTEVTVSPLKVCARRVPNVCLAPPPPNPHRLILTTPQHPPVFSRRSPKYSKDVVASWEGIARSELFVMVVLDFSYDHWEKELHCMKWWYSIDGLLLL